jgi:hypothetical protein
MDDALRTRLTLLTWLVGALLVAVLSLGFYRGGVEYLATFAVLGVLTAIVTIVAVGVAPVFRMESGDSEGPAD